MNYLQWMAAAAFLVFMVYKIHPAVRKAWRTIFKKPEYHHRMLVAVRRRQAVALHLLELGAEKQSETIRNMEKLWEKLLERWQAHSYFAGGFSTSEKGMALQAEEEWAMINFYDVANYEAFIKCQAILEEIEFLSLRTHCDIRLSIGKRWVATSGNIRGLF